VDDEPFDGPGQGALSGFNWPSQDFDAEVFDGDGLTVGAAAAGRAAMATAGRLPVARRRHRQRFRDGIATGSSTAVAGALAGVWWFQRSLRRADFPGYQANRDNSSRACSDHWTRHAAPRWSLAVLAAG